MVKQAVLLVGGLGTRLGALTQHTPKPMMPIGDATFLDLLVDEVARHGMSEILLLCGYRAEAIVSAFDGQQRRGATIACITESEPLGTGGALLSAADRLDDVFLLLNGDSLLEFNLLDLMTVGPAQGWLGKVALRQVADTGRFGRVALEGERVTSFAEKTGGGPGLINGGVYLLQRRVLDLIRTTPCSLEQAVLPQLVEQGALFGRCYESYFIDIGVPEDLARAQAELADRLRPAVFFDQTCLWKRSGVAAPDTGSLTWVDGVIETIKLVNDAGWLVVVMMTSQDGDEPGDDGGPHPTALRSRMHSDLMMRGAHIDAFYPKQCPAGWNAQNLHGQSADTSGTVEALHTVSRDWKIDLHESFFFGKGSREKPLVENTGIRYVSFRKGDVLSHIFHSIKGKESCYRNRS